MSLDRFTPARLLAAVMTALVLGGCAAGSRGTDQAAEVSTTAQSILPAERKDIAKGIYELAYSAKQDAVFVAVSGGFSKVPGKPMVARLNPQTLEVEKEIPLRRQAFGVALDDAKNRLYVGNTVDLSVTVVDTQHNRVVRTIQLMGKKKSANGRPAYTHDLRELVVDSANNRLYVTGHSEQGSVLFVVDTRRNRVIKTIPGLGNAKAPGLVLDAEGGRVFTSNLLGEVVVVDTKTQVVTQRFQTQSDQPMNIAYDSTTQRLFITDQGLKMITDYQAKSIEGFKSRHPGNRILVLNANTGEEIKSVPVSDGPLALRLDEQRKRLYVTSRAGAQVSVFDSETYALLHSVNLPPFPQSIAFDEARNVLFVTVKADTSQDGLAEDSVARIQLP
ncbi:MAG: YncE family protein [Burkholderiaceae bacterium]|nr:YncE family protein [Burkholderiaceae bacterium]